MFTYIINISMMYKNYVSHWGKILAILGGENMIFKWCRSLYNDYICILYEYEIISRECTSVCNSNYIKKNILWKHSVMILNGSWKWEKDKFKKKNLSHNWVASNCQKRYCVPPPPLFVSNSACLLFYSRQMNQWRLPFDWHTEHI